VEIKNAVINYPGAARRGGPITGNRVVPSPWQKTVQGGPMLVAGDIVTKADGHACLYCTQPGHFPWQRWHDVALEAAHRLPIIDREG
jgi:hypothetical protein